uniref:Purple acid phosphatase N-terminal domain-containing protein n=1 Tax=Hyaloperonospora arabidopsidis (strain Emoy2) TaxID=559515 RepID=M4BY01_HYAAE
MAKLEAGKRYFYRVGDKMGKLSDVRDFPHLPLEVIMWRRTCKGSSMSFLVYGDLNRPVGTTADFAEDNGMCGTTMALVREDMEQAASDPSEHRYVAVMHVGGLAYAMGTTYVWD